MSYPIKCPICEGHGKVHGGFYSHTPDAREWTALNTAEVCRSCGGQGIIWTKDEVKPGGNGG